MSRYLYGIDFGTTNSAISIYDSEQDAIVQTISVPSILYFPSKQEAGKPLISFVGHEAIEQYLADGMSGRFMKSIKRVLPISSFTHTHVLNKKMTAPDLVALILIHLKAKADAFIGQECTKAIIGRPVFFDENNPERDQLAQKRLAQAAELAGITEYKFQYEPIAAAFTYERDILHNERVLVADLGGGTTDFTLMNLSPKAKGILNREQDILKTSGIYIGGDAFDSSFMWERGTPHFGRGLLYQSMPGKHLEVPLPLFHNITTWEKMNFFNSNRIRNEIEGFYFFSNKHPKLKNLLTLIENNLGYQVFRQIEQTKIALSIADEATFQFNRLGIEIDEPSTLPDYETIIARDLKKIADCLDGFVAESGEHLNSLDTIFLTGGTSMVRPVKALFEHKFPSVKLQSGDNFISVAKGLAYSGYLFHG